MDCSVCNRTPNNLNNRIEDKSLSDFCLFEKTEELVERNELCLLRIASIPEDGKLPTAFAEYVGEVCHLIEDVQRIYELAENGKLRELSIENLKELHDKAYDRLSPSNYDASYLNPEFAIDRLGRNLGGILSFLYADMTCLISAAYEGRLDTITYFEELFIEIYGLLLDEIEQMGQLDPEEKAIYKSIHDAIYWFYHDYSELFVQDNVTKNVNPSYNFFKKIVEEADLTDLRYLYWYGSPIGENEIQLAQYINSLDEERIEAIASTYTEGFRIGYEVTERDITKKASVKVEFPIGFERIIRQACKNFKALGLEPMIVRESTYSFTGRSGRKRNCYSTAFNPQFDFDHKDDRGFYLDKSFVERYLEVLSLSYENEKKNASLMGGPAVIEMFGEPDFEPQNKADAYSYTDSQNELNVYMMSQVGQIAQKYMPGDEYSFTIIAFPLPSIGERFEEIFDKTVEINTLDYMKYRNMQQCIIDVLDQGEMVHVTGRGANETDIFVSLHPIADPTTETKFENCVADVNIPVGEVFTSPVLKGTRGILHVSKVYLNGLSFKNLRLTFEDGRITEYTCSNFPTEEENKKYIYDNILFHHETLPIGEFAIGTNTIAYRMGIDFGIQDKLPILIAEKTGPHFAVGDTCYSHAEDSVVHNPDGKEIIARSNEIADLRDEDPSAAYFNCHTDITIPYDELKDIVAIGPSGEEYPIICDGRFVVAGTEELNIPLDK